MNESPAIPPPSSPLLIEDSRFVDERGRTLILRGMNLGAGSKLPSSPDGATHRRDGFFDHRNVSFVGRPLPLAEADEHFDRLLSWGFTHLRLAITWEAVEHAGPGIYDTAFLDYLEALVRKAVAHGMTLHIDPHQDVWSRFTGGAGAPGWTLEAVGMVVSRVHETGAAILHQVHGDPFPRMVWPTNAAKLAAATMFTLFFAGNVFAPRTLVDGEPVQDFFQRRYCHAMAQVAERMRGFPHVLGYETMNEPTHGFIGQQDLGRREGLMRLGESPTPFQSMLLGAGIPQEVPVYDVRLIGVVETERRLLNPAKARLWRENADCIWRSHGVWDVGAHGEPRLLRPDYFSSVDGRRPDFSQDFYRPFANRYARAVRSAHPRALLFVQTEIGMRPPRWEAHDADRIVYAPHWYDSLTLVMKRFHGLIAYDSLRNRIVVGRRAIRRSIAEQLRTLRRQAREHLRDAPFILGETGIPFDLRNRRALRRRDLGVQVRAADRVMRGVESALVSMCWWNYAADNDSAHGDQWNGEDFSLFSRDPKNHPSSSRDGGRGLEALVRPYPRVVAGEPLALRFNRITGSLTFIFRHGAGIPGPTELFVPSLQYPRGFVVSVSDGSYRLHPDAQLVTYEHSSAREVHVIRIRRQGRR